MMQDEKKENGILNFIQNNRKGIFIFCGSLLALFVIFIVFLIINDSINKNAIAQSEEYAARFNELRWYLEDENYSDEVNTLFIEMETFAKKNRGLAASRVYSFIARIHSARGNWALCEEAWLETARTGDKTYLAPIALFNAAAAMEEQGKIQEAIEYLKKSIEHPFEFPAAPRAQFNIGRLYEALGDKQNAIDAYREVLINWQNIPFWPDVARTAILKIEVGN